MASKLRSKGVKFNDADLIRTMELQMAGTDDLINSWKSRRPNSIAFLGKGECTRMVRTYLDSAKLHRFVWSVGQGKSATVYI